MTIAKVAEWASGPVAWWIFSTAIATMPTPDPMDRWYGWLYNFLQRLGANHTLVVTK